MQNPLSPPLWRRLGPRPLPLHLMSAITSWQSCLPALQWWSSISPDSLPMPISPIQNQLLKLAQSLSPEPGKNPQPDIYETLNHTIFSQSSAYLDGLQKWRVHPARRNLAPMPVIAQHGSTLLRSFAETGVPVLVIPSLVNTSDVLDLDTDRSLLRYLAANGIRPLLVDWQMPDADHLDFAIADYISVLSDFLSIIPTRKGEKIAVMGYCMGGMLATALASLYPEKVKTLSLLATPWDFQNGDPAGAQKVATMGKLWQPVIQSLGYLPLDFVQTLFWLLDPLTALRKFTRFSALKQDGEAARQFVLLEDWLNDGVPLAGKVAQMCLNDWYGENHPAHGKWEINGHAITPQSVKMPTLAFVPAKDRIVPPASALALAENIPLATILSPPLGHIGMVVGSQAEKSVYLPLAQFLAK